MNESLTKAIDSCNIVIADLQDAQKRAKGIDEAYIRGLIERARTFKKDIAELRYRLAIGYGVNTTPLVR